METTRCVIYHLREKKTDETKILFLQKAQESKNPFAFELPGGKMFDSFWQRLLYWFSPRKRQRDLQVKNLIREVQEETGILLDEEEVHFLGDKEYVNPATRRLTRVHQFFVMLDRIPQVQLGDFQEDKHSGFSWFSLREYEKLVPCGVISENSKIL